VSQWPLRTICFCGYARCVPSRSKIIRGKFKKISYRERNSAGDKEMLFEIVAMLNKS
jgi:hypothetical protein